MTYYSYLCYSCGHKMEYHCKMGEAPEVIPCDKCKKTAGRIFGANVSVPNPTHPSRAGRGKG